MLACQGRRENDRRAAMDGCCMGDHEIMRSMAVDYQRAAEGAADPERRDRLAGLAEYCQKMAVAMERFGGAGAGRASAKPPAKPAL
jgi:hypothetical protein